MVVIKNTDTGKYLAPSGSLHSYTKRLEDARTFGTIAEAKRECCENETPVEFGGRS